MKNLKLAILLLLAVILFSPAPVFAASLSQAEAEKVTRKAIELVQQGNYKDVYYKLSAEELRKASTYSSLVQFFEPIKSLGKVKNIKLSSIEFSDKGDSAALKYNVAYEKGSAVASFTVKKKEGSAQILGINYDSKVIEKAFQSRIKESNDFVGKILQMSQPEKFKEIYSNYTSTEFKKATSFEKFQNIMKLINEKSMGLKYNLKNFNIQGEIYRLEYVCTGKEQSPTLSFTLVKEDKDFKILSISFKL